MAINNSCCVELALSLSVYLKHNECNAEKQTLFVTMSGIVQECSNQRQTMDEGALWQEHKWKKKEAEKSDCALKCTYLLICVIINCDVCLQASTQDRRIFRTFSRSSGQSFDWPMWMSKSLNKAIWLLISTMSCRTRNKIWKLG